MDKFEISPNASIKTKEEFEKKLAKLVNKNTHVLRITGSICPECAVETSLDKAKIDAVIYEENGKVWIIKECPKHGIIKDLYWGDYEMYERARKFADPGIEILTPQIKKLKEKISCPDDCGLCLKHKSHTNLGNIVVTNRCNLSCWYCFFFAKEGEAIYEPTLEQIRMMLRKMKNQKPVPCNAVQITGGEPTLRKDIVEIVKICKEEGYDHVQFNTNGIEFSKNLKLINDLKKAAGNKGSIIAYLSFDGLTPETNPKNYWEIPDILENCRKAGFQLVLVPTVIKGINDHELGDIIRFAFDNNDVIRGVNFQPVSLVGRMPRKEREKRRITIPDACRKIEEQTNGDISMEDFFTVPSTTNITNFIEAIKGQQKYRLSAHFACGVATYVFRDNNKMIPITKFVDVNGLFKYLNELSKNIKSSRFNKTGKTISSLKLLWSIRKFVDEKKKPKNLSIAKLLSNAFGRGNFSDVAEFQLSSLFVGMMHFQDLYNYDIDRVQRCCIHYAIPDGRLIPFCAFNVIPQVFRDKTQKEFSISAKEWEKKHGKKLVEEKYVRKLIGGKKQKIKEFYEKFK
jgi:hypothetical protein